jgi:hypothetical protein
VFKATLFERQLAICLPAPAARTTSANDFAICFVLDSPFAGCNQENHEGKPNSGLATSNGPLFIDAASNANNTDHRLLAEIREPGT